jgi:AAA+ superfamily predicted ATPase
MPEPDDFGQPLENHVEVFGQAIDECLALYRASAEVWNRNLPEGTSPRVPASRVALMDDLARGLMVKIFLTILQADRRFSAEERDLAHVLVYRLWGRRLTEEELVPALQGLVPLADKFDWYQLVRPFADVPELEVHTSEVETIAMRFGNLVAKADGELAAEEAHQLKGVLTEINRHLRPVPIEREPARPVNPLPYEEISSGGPLPVGMPVKAATAKAESTPPTQTLAPEERLQAALESLDELIGLDAIKGEVRELARFLRVQHERQQAGLPRTQVSLHTVFAGNPGTGKTSVGRILGEVLGALGIVAKGHLVEADRSTLVAGYMGQTAERTNKIIDQALDGVLFIDEAYSLVSDEGEDPYGHEALQILLKRMEDNRDRLVVVLAGYPEEMNRLLAANPGLSSRFQRTFLFPDYSVVELCRIFETLCEKNHYVLPAETRARLILGFDYLVKHRDEHFGNGRLVRNAFEHAIRRLANRIADIVPLTKELLTQLAAEDVLLSDVPESAFGPDAVRDLQVNVVCPECGQMTKVKASHLGRRAQCNKCRKQFVLAWGEPVR